MCPMSRDVADAVRLDSGGGDVEVVLSLTRLGLPAGDSLRRRSPRRRSTGSSNCAKGALLDAREEQESRVRGAAALGSCGCGICHNRYLMLGATDISSPKS